MRGMVYRRCTTCLRRADGGHHDRDCPGRNSTWYFIVDVGRDQDGKRQQVHRGGFATRREADRSLREVLSRVDVGSYVPRSKLTVQHFLVDEWLPTQLPPKVSPNRFRNIRNAIRIRLVPYIGQLELQELNAVHLDRLYSALLSGRPHGGVTERRRPYAPATVLQTHGVIRKALRDGLKWGFVEQNVATLADPPSNASVQAARRQAIRIWSPAELTKFLTRTQSHWLHPLWVLATTTGLRRGELSGIVDSSLDLKAGRLVVEWQLVPEEQFDGEDAIAQSGITTPVHKPVMKTTASSRSVDLDNHTLRALRQWRQVRDKWAADLDWPNFDSDDFGACRLGHGRSRHGRFFFCWPDTRHLNPDWLTHEYTRMCRDADVPIIRLQDARHTHASLMLASGENPKIVQERLGWTSVAFMLETYSHLLPGMQREAADRFADGIFNDTDLQSDIKERNGQ